jgi:hypothetical protein
MRKVVPSQRARRVENKETRRQQFLQFLKSISGTVIHEAAQRLAQRQKRASSSSPLYFEPLEERALLTVVPAVTVYESEVTSPTTQAVSGWEQIDGLQNSFTLDQQRVVEISGIANAITPSGQDEI